MKTIKILGFIALLLFGIFAVIFGEFDDSPGAQGIGLILALTAVWNLIKIVKK